MKRQNNRWVIETDKIPQNNRPILVGIINQLLVETGYSRGTLLDIDLELIDSKNGETLWSSKLLGNEAGGMGGGIFEDVDKLKNWLAKTLQDEALNKFTSQEFQNVVKIRSE